MSSNPEESLPERWSEAAQVTDMWLDPADDPRESNIIAATDERSTLLDYLRRYRLTLELKCSGLDAEQLARRSVPPSTMSLLGLLRHMAAVELVWFRQVLDGQDVERPYRTPEDREGEWTGAVADPDVVAEAWQRWRSEVRFAEEWVARCDDLATVGTMRDGETVQLRDILVHMIEEYARHCGHADFLRERIDGRVGQ